MTTTTGDDVGPGDGATRPLRKDAERNRQRILQAAREELADRGLTLTLNDVAHRAGVGVGTVYRHFPDKDRLVDAALAGQLEAYVDVIEAALDADTPWAALVQILDRGLAAHVANRALRDVSLRAGHGDEQAVVADRILHLIDGALVRAQAEGSLRPDVTLADIVMIHFMVTEFADHSEDVRPGAYRRYLHLLLDGLRASAATRDLGPPLREAEADAIGARWVDAHRHRAH